MSNYTELIQLLMGYPIIINNKDLKNYLKNFGFLSLAILFIVVATIIENKSSHPKTYKVDIEKFSNILYAKEDKANDLLNSVYQKVKLAVEAKNLNIFDALKDIDFNYLNKEGLVLLVYINDSLGFWSDNSVEINQYFSKSKLNNTIINLNNAWYYLKSIHDKNLEVIGLIELKKDFSFQNEYLANSFHKDFELPNTIEISKIPLSYSYDIYDKEKNYLFSLAPTNSILLKDQSCGLVELFYILGILLLLLSINKWFRHLSKIHPRPHWHIVLISIVLLSIRYLMLKFKFPALLYDLPLFDPKYYTESDLFASLGDFVINSFLILLFTSSIFYLFRIDIVIRYFKNKTSLIKYSFGIGLMLIIALFFFFIIQLLQSLVINSNIPLEAHKVMELNMFSFFAYAIFGVLILTLMHTIDRVALIINQILTSKESIAIISTSLLIFSILAVTINLNLTSGSLPFIIALSIVIFYVHLKGKKYHFSIYAGLILIASIYVTIFVYSILLEKQNKNAKVLISELVNERDKIAENLLVSIGKNIKTDETLKTSLEKETLNKSEIENFLKKKYFGGYLSKFNISIELCDNGDFFGDPEKNKNCNNQYKKIIDETGTKIKDSGFYYINTDNGSISYLGIISFAKETGQSKHTLYVKIDEKTLALEIGYPDLLIEDKTSNKDPLSEFSYAKYRSGKLASRSGSFPYDLSDKMLEGATAENSQLIVGDYHHYIYKTQNNKIVLTAIRVSNFDKVVAFSYIFMFFTLLLIIGIAANHRPLQRFRLKLNFENKLLLTMLFVLILSFVMVTTGTIYYNSKQFRQKHNTNINEKLESVVKTLEMEQEKGFISDTSLAGSNTLIMNELLKILSSIYYTDINLYNYQGRLIATSRPEIFNQGLIGPYMEPEAYRQMTINEKTRFIQNEKIGKLQYASSYALFNHPELHKPFFINLPYFTKPSELKKEISNLLVAIINFYVVLFVVVALLAFFMANKITQPLRMLQSKFRKIELGKESEQIVYTKKDEVGALVEEYNRMVIKLAESIDLLAKTERESAWREMAKQIAHEIKNPLTPMKLSVQFLQRAWQNNDAAFETKLNKSTQTLIDQINTLSNIATEFSNFAKMPKPKKEVVDLVVRIEHTVTLFINTENLIIESNIEQFDKLIIIADREQISRVLTNLTKNAIQAVPGDKEGYIQIIVEKDENNVLIKVIDNGSGIADEQKEKLFMPSFTTKSSGMGMGLPIVKDIIESANGKIWFQTEVNKGTTFFVKFPLASEEEILEINKTDE